MISVSSNKPKICKHKAETPEQFPLVAYKPCKSTTAMMTKIAVTSTPPQKTTLPMSIMVGVDSENKET